MENRHRILQKISVEVSRSVYSERDGRADPLKRARRRLRFTSKTPGADQGFFEAKNRHGLRCFRRRRLLGVREKAFLIGWILNLKRLAGLLV